MEKRMLAKIAVSAAIFSIDRPYTYLIPETLIGTVKPGVRVIVPFGRGNKRSEGVVLSVDTEDSVMELKAIESVLDSEPVLTDEQIKLALWMRDRCFCTMYEAVHAMLPAGMWFKDGKRKASDKTQRFISLAIPSEDAVTIASQKKMKAPHQSNILSLLASVGEAGNADIIAFTGAPQSSINALIKEGLLVSEDREVFRYQLAYVTPEAGEVILNEEQQKAYDGLVSHINVGKPSVSLLYGVTGSGKTSVYIKLAKYVTGLNRTVIIMVPEISLTPQFVSIFSSHFGNEVAVLHSSLSIGERYDEWKRIKSGSVKVVIGTRSAVFAPLENLGLIVIDEEQEHTYKSENAPRYNARDVAKYRCYRSNALLVLGSATPSVESMYFAENNKYSLFTLKNRYNAQPLPEVSVINMRDELKKGNSGVFSSALREELRQNLENGRQSILFINRRGASSSVVCGECGYTFMCSNCSVSMTYHSVGHKLMCHYCGHVEPVPDFCPECGGKLKFIGAGTQKAEEELENLFPGNEIVRMDADTVSRSASHEKLLEHFKNDRVPFLLGTQMITKGLDFENVTLVGVLSADQSLYSGSYRSRERTFSLITQVIGRSGRGDKKGRAIIQTYTPENETIILSSHQDYDGFFKREIEMRSLSKSPPFSDLISVTVSGIDEAMVLRGCIKLLETFKFYTKDIENIEILGPAPDGVTKVNNRYRYKLLISGENNRYIRDMVCHSIKEFYSDKSFRGLSAFADSDPMD